TSRSPRRLDPGSTRLVSSTKGRRASRSPSSPGPPSTLRMTATAQAAAPARGGFVPAWAAVRTRVGLVVLLLVLATVGRWWTVHEMQGMDGGPWTDLGTFAWFVGVWVVMMAAMMFPSVAPTVALYSRLTRSRALVLPLLFTSGYLLVWAAVGVLAFGIAVGGGSFAGGVLSWD